MGADVNWSTEKKAPMKVLFQLIPKSTNYKNDKDSDMAILPHLLDVAISFTPIHDFIPSNNEGTSYIGHQSFSPSVRAQNFGLASYYDKSNEEIVAILQQLTSGSLQSPFKVRVKISDLF